MSAITTHVLDTARGRPAQGITIILEVQESPDHWKKLAQGATDADGRITDLLAPKAALQPGLYRMIFKTGDYFESIKIQGFYPQVTVNFEIRQPNEHYHIPLLLSPFGYSTYRGS